MFVALTGHFNSELWS